MQVVTGKELKGEVLDRFSRRGGVIEASIEGKVKEIVSAVKSRRDEALLEYTREFDGVDLSGIGFRVEGREVAEAYERLSEKELSALKKAAGNIKSFHEAQLCNKLSIETVSGVQAGQLFRPLSTVGIYAPGGRAVYPSTVLMCSIPAKVAGVERLVLCSPPNKNGEINPAVLVAADIAGVDEVFKVGGAQAVAAMAYGTETIPKVDKIVGPGNVYVTAAKLLVSRDVAIDLPAGPSEIVIIADDSANPEFVAYDMMAQAEHDPDSLVVLLTPSRELATKVNGLVEEASRKMTRASIIVPSISRNGLIVLVEGFGEALNLVNRIAPEHLEIQTRDPESLLGEVRNAGAVFLGKYSPVAFGDYSAGTNHVLPTGGYARVYSGLSVMDFTKRITFLKCSREGFANLAEMTVTLARLEGLEAHALSVLVRKDEEV